MISQVKIVVQLTFGKEERGLVWIASAISIVLGTQFFASPWANASHGSHSGARRYGDVIITRNADGSYESRDASGPTVTYSDGSSSGSRHAKSKSKPGTTHATKYGGHVAAKPGKSTKSASASKGKAGHHQTAHRHSSGGGDVEIIRNADGSIEARDTQ